MSYLLLYHFKFNIIYIFPKKNIQYITAYDLTNHEDRF